MCHVCYIAVLDQLRSKERKGRVMSKEKYESIKKELFLAKVCYYSIKFICKTGMKIADPRIFLYVRSQRKVGVR